MSQKPSPRTRFTKRFEGSSINQLIPNLLTTLSLCGGLIGMRYALNGDFKHACIALLISACLDAMDGRMARLLNATSRFGAEYDSLSDFFCFGIAPAFTVYSWALESFGRFAFIPSLFYAVCLALRLARFNAALDRKQFDYMSNFFTGVPAPAAAGLALFPVFLGLESKKLGLSGLGAIAHAPYLPIATLIGAGLLAISSIPVWSFKNFRVPRHFVLPILLIASLYAALLVAEPWGALVLAGIVYIVMMPFSKISFMRLKKAAETKLSQRASAPTER